MRSRTVVKLYPELRNCPSVLESVCEVMAGISDEDVLKSKYQKSKLRKSVNQLIKENKKRKEDNFWLGQIKVVKTWAKSKNIKVKFIKKGDDCYWPSKKLIQINSNIKLESQFYLFLHECGHYLVINSKKYHKRYPFEKYNNFYIDNDFLIDEEKIEKDQITLLKSKVEGKIINKKKKDKLNLYKFEYCMLRIQEEIESWDKGENLAIRLDLTINNKNFLKEKFKRLETYIDWAVLERGPE